MNKKIFEKYQYTGLMICGVVIVGILCFFLFFQWGAVTKTIGMLLSVMKPFIYGAVIAYLLAPVCNYFEKYVRKGDRLYVEGKIQSRDWTDKRGISRRSIDIIVDNMEMLSPRRADKPESEAKPTTEPVLGPENNGGDYPF